MRAMPMGHPCSSLKLLRKISGVSSENKAAQRNLSASCSMPRLRWPTAKSFSKSSKKNNPVAQVPMDEPVVPLGEIVATHGLLGWLKLNPFNPETTALKPGVEVFIEAAGAQAPLLREASSPHKRQLLIKFLQVDSIDAAAPYVGSTLSVSQTALEVLAP